MKAGRWTTALLGLLSLCGLACGAERARPSILLVVFDTLRADAVSFYGDVHGTTPGIDALARQGLVYTSAYAPAPWTIPSHATLFTGLRVDQHQTGMGRHTVLSEELDTLAERLQRAGYETAAFSENSFIADAFQMLQGFETRRASRFDQLAALAVFDPSGEAPVAVKAINPVTEIRTWISSRTDERPFFIFVNLFDPHVPYEIRSDNPFVAGDATGEQIRQRSQRPEFMLCGSAPTEEQMNVLRGLYLGDVAAADLKLRKILALLRGAGLDRNLVTIVTSDHGELFGERRMMGHEFSLHSSLLRVPLVVHGLPGVEPAVVDTPVALLDVTPSILRWTGQVADGALPGHPLPEAHGAEPPERDLFAAYTDQYLRLPDQLDFLTLHDREKKRRYCGPEDPVFGKMAALTRYPFKLLWFERYPAELYDLSWDPRERSNLAARKPEVATKLAAEVEARLETSALFSEHEPAEEVSAEVRETLRALGYLEE